MSRKRGDLQEQHHSATLIAQRREASGAARAAAKAGPSRGRALVFGAIVVAVLLVGGYLAFGGFFNRPAAAVGTIDVQSSMAGFTPAEIHVTAGTTAVMSWWTEDAAMHLQNGVHTLIAPDLGLHEELAAESRRTVTWQVPDKPGTYDVYCDSCCGGKASTTMHGKIVIEPSAS
jgi:heme/copper-type cytochrome/quinol oxidase subunit 2